MTERPDLKLRVFRVLGEVALIFLGITAALWFENANADRQERDLEAQILGEMAAAIEADTTDLHVNLRVGDSLMASIDTLLARLRSSAPYDESLAAHFGQSSRYVRFFHNPAAYEHLRSAGFDVISDDELRHAIITYYDQSVPLVMWLDRDMVVNRTESWLLPQMMEKFEYSSPFEPAVPLAYSTLKSDAEYQNALRLVFFGVAVQMDGTRGAVANAEALLGLIERELSGG